MVGQPGPLFELVLNKEVTSQDVFYSPSLENPRLQQWRRARNELVQLKKNSAVQVKKRSIRHHHGAPSRNNGGV